MAYSPGSREAKRHGCTCPAIDNAYGQGAVIDGHVYPDQFYIDLDCPLHRNARSLEGSGMAISLAFWDEFTEEQRKKLGLDADEADPER